MRVSLFLGERRFKNFKDKLFFKEKVKKMILKKTFLHGKFLNYL